MTHSSPLRALGRAISWHRRKLAVLAAVAAVLAGVNAANPGPGVTRSVVTAARPLAAGHPIAAADLQVRQLSPSAVPDTAVADPGTLVGKVVVAAVPDRQVLTELSVVSPRLPAAQDGTVIAPLRLADDDLVPLLTIGDTVDIVAAQLQTGKAGIVAHGARLVTIPELKPSSGLAASKNSQGALVLVEVSPTDAVKLAAAAISARLSVVMR